MDTPEGNLVVTGKMKGFENGNPSPSGPVVKSLDINTQGGPLELVMPGATWQAEVQGLSIKYGDPQAGGPGTPTETNPDVIKINRMGLVYVESGIEDYVTGLSVERTGDTTTTIRILDGSITRKGEGRVDVQTSDSDPLVINTQTLSPTGTIELLGADGTQALIRPTGTPGLIEITINDETVGPQADCTDAAIPAIEAILALYQALPLY